MAKIRVGQSGPYNKKLSYLRLTMLDGDHLLSCVCNLLTIVLIFSFFLIFLTSSRLVKICFHSHNRSKASLSKKVGLIGFNESPLKMIKNVFYFILKALKTIRQFSVFQLQLFCQFNGKLTTKLQAFLFQYT